MTSAPASGDERLIAIAAPAQRACLTVKAKPAVPFAVVAALNLAHYLPRVATRTRRGCASEVVETVNLEPCHTGSSGWRCLRPGVASCSVHGHAPSRLPFAKSGAASSVTGSGFPIDRLSPGKRQCFCGWASGAHSCQRMTPATLTFRGHHSQAMSGDTAKPHRGAPKARDLTAKARTELSFIPSPDRRLARVHQR